MEIAHKNGDPEYLLETCTEAEIALGAVDVHLRHSREASAEEVLLRDRLSRAVFRMAHALDADIPAPEPLSVIEADLCVRALRWTLRPNRKSAGDPFAALSSNLLVALESAQ